MSCACGGRWCHCVRMTCYYFALFSLCGCVACFVAVVGSYRLRLCLVPRAVWLPVSLLFVIRPVLRHGERGARLAAFVLGWLVARSRCLSSLGRAACPHGALSSWVILAVGACCVDYVAGAVARRSCGIFVLSIGCIYRLIGFLICLVCPLLPLLPSSVR